MKAKKFIALILLIISVGNSFGIPLFSHSCSQSNVSDLHIYSAAHHCDDDHCGKKEQEIVQEIIVHDNSLSLHESPCCSFETDFLTASDQIISKSQIKISQLFIIIESFFVLQSEKVFFTIKSLCVDTPIRLFGSSYRLAIQSILC